jgi:hypothetical protein
VIQADAVADALADSLGVTGERGGGELASLRVFKRGGKSR